MKMNQQLEVSPESFLNLSAMDLATAFKWELLYWHSRLNPIAAGQKDRQSRENLMVKAIEAIGRLRFGPTFSDDLIPPPEY